MLYLGEGAKKKRGQLVMTNTDPFILNFFIEWAITFLSVTREQLRIQVHLYENMDIEKELIFWQNTLCLASTQFYRPAIRTLKPGSFSYPGEQRHGTCQVYLFGVGHEMRVKAAIQAFQDTWKQQYLRD